MSQNNHWTEDELEQQISQITMLLEDDEEGYSDGDRAFLHGRLTAFKRALHVHLTEDDPTRVANEADEHHAIVTAKLAQATRASERDFLRGERSGHADVRAHNVAPVPA